MTRRYPLHVLAGLVVAAGGASLVFSAPEAKALCIPNNVTCSQFDPSSASDIQNAPVTGTISANATALKLTRIGVQFIFSPDAGVFTTPFTITNIKVTNAFTSNSTKADFTFGDVTVTDANVQNLTNLLNLTSNITSNINLASAPGATLSFTLPQGLTGPGSGATISAAVVYERNNVSTNLANSDYFNTTNVPGPLPILGAGVAFGYSRSLRRRIKLAKAA